MKIYKVEPKLNCVAIQMGIEISELIKLYKTNSNYIKLKRINQIYNKLVIIITLFTYLIFLNYLGDFPMF